jgi:hypothetical protein
MISGMAYHYLDGLQYIRRVAQHFGLKKINLVTITGQLLLNYVEI